jgi:hypothetical protein
MKTNKKMDVCNVQWNNGFICYGNPPERMVMEKMCTTSISTVYRCKLRDVKLIVKKFIYDDSIEYKMEVKVIRRMLRRQLNFVTSWPISRRTIVMESMENDLSKWHGPVENVKGIMQRIVHSLKEMVACGLYYTDMKTQNIMYRSKPNGTTEIKFGDLSACAYKGTWCSQTYPYPTPTYDCDDYHNTIVKACEKVVVWGVGLVWLMLMGHLNLVIQTLSHEVQTPRSARSFQRSVNKDPEIPLVVKQIVLLQIDRLDEINV